jgi:hypothetical protein
MTANLSNRNSTAIAIVIFLLLSFICIGVPVILLMQFNVMYVFNVIVTIIALTIAFSLPFRLKRISGYAITAFVVGILFFASSISQFVYDSAIAPLPISEQFALSRVIQPQKISQGLLYLGMGIVVVVAYFGKAKSVKFKQLTATQFTELLWCALGVFYILIGIYYTFNGFHSL